MSETKLNDIQGWDRFTSTIRPKLPDLNPPKKQDIHALLSAGDDVGLDWIVTSKPASPSVIRSHFVSSEVQELEKGLNALHVEELFERCVELFERLSRTKERIESTRVQWFQNLMDIWEFEELDKIHQEEISADRYKIDSISAKSAVEATEAQLAAVSHEIKVSYDFLLSYAPPNVDRPTKLSPYSTATLDARLEEGASLAGASASLDVEGDNTKGKALTVRNISKPVIRSDVQQRYTSAVTQYFSVVGAEAAAEKRLRGEKENAAYQEKAVDFNLRRIKCARMLMQRKILETTDSNGALNHKVRIEALERQLDLDLKYSMAHLRALRSGLSSLFGYSDAIDETTLDFEICVLWLRRATYWFANVTRNDESFTLAVLVKRFATQWQEGKSEIRIAFSTDQLMESSPQAASLFKQYKWLRLRGIKAVVDGSDERDWMISINFVEKKSKLEPLTASGKPLIVTIGRVSSRKSSRQPELAGAHVLHNASPLGSWEISGRAIDVGKLKSSVADIQVELLLAGQRV